MWRNDFLNALGPVDGTQLDIVRAQTIVDRNLPRRLFRFRSDNVREYSLLQRQGIWLTPPDQFNDPYDSSFSLFQSKLVREQMKHSLGCGDIPAGLEAAFPPGTLARIRNEPDPMTALATIACAIDPQLAKYTPEALVKVLDDAAEHVMQERTDHLRRQCAENLRIACFTERLDSLPMWAHYASSHRGFCVEYGISQLSSNDPRRRCMFPVIYTNKIFDWTPYFAISIGDKSRLNPFVAILAAIHKVDDWQYEKEWRLVIPLKDVGPEYRMPRPIAFYAGLHASSEAMARLGQVAASIQVPLRRMKLGANGLEVGT